MRKGGYYYLNQGAHKGESIESMLQIDRSYLEWLIDKCKWTDDQTRDIIAPYLGRKPKKTVAPKPAAAPKPTQGKKRGKPTITDADLSLF